MPTFVNGFAKAVAKVSDDLLDLDDSFVGGANETGKGFPWVLLEQAQATAGFLGSGEVGIILGEGGEDFFKVHLELKIVSEPLPILLRFSGLGVELLVFYMEANPTAGDDVFPFDNRAIFLTPAEGLAGGKRGGEIVIAQREGGRSRHALVSDERVGGMTAKFLTAVQE